jgi:tetratricopeptide (TPR) repeat protein
MIDKGLSLLQRVIEVSPYSASEYATLARVYLGLKNYGKATEYVGLAMGIAPFESEYLELAGTIFEQMNKKSDASALYQKALVYNTNNYEIRQKIRSLENQEDLLKYLPSHDVYSMIRESNSESYIGNHDWYYVLDQKYKIVYPEGTSEEYFQYVVKILSERGIDNWKEQSISYNYYRQRLVIEKVEVVKKNGNKISAEVNENNLVFPKLEVGDAIHLKYKLESYSYGRFAKNFWDKYVISSFVPSEISRYCLLIAKNQEFKYKMENADIKPKITDANDFTLYTWENMKEPAMKGENYMPELFDVGKTLHLSSINSWQEIATWYNDISAPQAKSDFEVKRLYNTIFTPNKTYTQLEKAKMIYEYIIQNIRYSSVPFRQGAYIPQTAAKTIQTKLGDCKDLSTLYASLARDAGQWSQRYSDSFVGF